MVRTGGRWKRTCHYARHLASGLPVCKLRGKQLISKPGRTRRYHVPADSARVIAALLALRDHVIAPILAGVRSPRMGRKPKTWTAIDWITPGTLEAMKPGRMQAHGSAEEVSG